MRRAGTSTFVLAGMLAGLAVGLLDGLSATLRAEVGWAGLLPSLALAAALDLLLGTVLGAGAALVVLAARWGRQVARPAWATLVAWALFGLAAAAGAAGAVLATASRNNRFLAAGVVALVSLALGVLGALLAPALARVFAAIAGRLGRLGSTGRRAPALSSSGSSGWSGGELEPSSPAAPPPSLPGLLLWAPLAALVLEGVIFYLVAATEAPLSRAVRESRVGLVGAVTVLLVPALAAGATRLRWPRWPFAAAAAGLLVLLPLVVFAALNWTRHLRFVPWRDVRVLLLIAVAGVGLVLWLTRRPPSRRLRRTVLLVAPPLAVLVSLWAAGQDLGRKALAGQGGVVGPVLATARPLLDFDGDGYPGLLGGGDCDDGDVTIHPAAEDWPDDGVDQDCDGQDLRAGDLRPPPLPPLPDGIPADLNLLLIVIDTLRADHLGAYGYGRPTSPTLDALAREGTLFENAWAHAPSTRYSLPAIVTGRWPSVIKWDMSKWWPGISTEQPTIAQVLKPSGYFNGAFYAYSYFDPLQARGFERGVDQYDARLAALHQDGVRGPVDSVGTSSRQMADEGIAFLSFNKDKKFFLSLHFYDPHLQYQAHPESPDFGRSQIDLYDSEIWFTDHHIGRVIDTLRQLGLYDKTAILVTGDHGEGFGEHGVTQPHGYHLYAPQTKVPLIARVPGLSPRRVDDPVGHVDIAPTLVNLARAPAPPTFLGRSLVDRMAGTAAPAGERDYVFQEVSFEPSAPGTASTERRGLVSRTHHLIWHWIPENVYYCYDILADPRETRDLWGTAAGGPACSELEAKLDRHLSLLKLAHLPPDYLQRLGKDVSPPDAKPTSPPTQIRVGTFGDRVRIAGYDVAVNEAAGSAADDAPASGPAGSPVVRVARGAEVELTTHFQVLGDLAGWRVFFHLIGPGGSWRNLDHVPVGGAFPVDRWRPGQQIRDRFTIPFGADVPAGLHTLMVGFWRPPSAANQRLPVSPADVQDGQDRMAVVSFHVSP